MGTLKKRLLKLEERFEIDDTDIFCNHVEKFYIKYGVPVPTPKEFEEAIMYKDRLEFVDSDFAKEILAKGGKEEWLECVDMIEEFIEEKRRKMS